MKLEDLVPPLELCKQIPEGAFADSVFVWIEKNRFGDIVIAERRAIFSTVLKAKILYPAPTLAEIMAELPRSVCADGQVHYLGQLSDTESSRWKICYSASSFYGLAVLRGLCATDDNPTAAALKLWLELKGIEV